jgi:hypothetical protein
VVVFITAALMSVISAAASVVGDGKRARDRAAAPDRAVGASAADAVPDAPSDEVLRVSP